MSEISIKPSDADNQGLLFLIKAMILTAMAAGMGWGIRGQYGHETGAMIAGALTSLTLVLLFAPKTSSLKAARFVAMMTVAMGIGGSMTYGQTVGLTHDAEVIGNWDSLRWGMIGLFVKGSIWIGFAGVFLGMGLSGKNYRSMELLLVMVLLIVVMFIGAWVINRPFDLSAKSLPQIYFSKTWELFPDKVDLKPRPEIWGGYLVSLTVLIGYVGFIKNDELALRMGLIGMIAGGLGFSGGQCLQAFPAWNPEFFTTGSFEPYAKYFKRVNWWNFMETTFGLIFGGILALGLWFNRGLIKIKEATEEVTIPLSVEIILLFVHLILLINTELILLPGKGIYATIYIEFGLLLATIPIVCIAGGRIWPFVLPLVVVALPIMGKTINNVSYRSDYIPASIGWLTLGQIPMAIMILASIILIIKSYRHQSSRGFASITLLLITLLYFGLNTVIFQFAWPWAEFTGRTPNQAVFMVCATCLIITAVINGIRSLSEKPDSY